MEEGQKQFRESFQNMPAEVLTCLQSSVGGDALEKFKSGQAMPTRDVGQKIGQCFSQVGGQQKQGQGGPDNRGQMSPDRQFDRQSGQPNQQGQNQVQNDLICSPKGTVASFVCAKNGRNSSGGPETTYFNRCTAEQDGAEVLYEGVCKGHKPCGSVANPVCGNDGNTWVSECYAIQEGGGVKYEGVCKNQSAGGQNQQNSGQQNQRMQFQPGSGATNPGNQQMPQQAGPGGCKGPEECRAYCEKNPEVCKNFQPPTTQQQGIRMMQQQGVTGQEQGFPGQAPGEMMPPKEGFPLQQGLPLNGTMPSTGSVPPPPGTQPMMQPGELQPIMPPPSGETQPPPDSTLPPQSYNSPSLDQFFGTVIGVFLR